MIPSGIKKKHIESAIAQIDREGIPPARQSVHYDLIFNGKRYPPKYVIFVAAYIANRQYGSARDFNAVEARDYLLHRNYEVVDRRSENGTAIAQEDDESAFPEGREKYVMHRSLERNSAIVRKAKEIRLEKEGRLACDVCETDFVESYGELGQGFIEAHHTKPVAQLDGNEKTKISDIALLCSNCHRMVHRGRPLLSVSELRMIYRQRMGT